MIQKETKRSLKSARTKEAIIAASTKLMRRYGYESTSIQQICEMSGVSTGTFYHLFQSKHDLLEYIFNEVSGYFKEVNFDYENDNPFCLIDGFIDNLLALTSGLSADTVFSAIFSPPTGNKTMFFKKRSSNVYLITALTGFQKAGKLRTDLSPKLMCSEIGNCHFGVFYASYTLEKMNSFEEMLRGVLYRLFSTYLVTPYLPKGYWEFDKFHKGCAESLKKHDMAMPRRMKTGRARRASGNAEIVGATVVDINSDYAKSGDA